MKPYHYLLPILLVLILGNPFIAENSTLQGKKHSVETDGELSVGIVPTSSHHKYGKAIELYWLKSHFYVVITNISNQGLNIWKEWSSWGWDNLSFALKSADDKSMIITRNMKRAWTKNYPDTFHLRPGEKYVLEVNFFNGTWISNGEKIDAVNWPKAGKLTAIYQIKSDDKTKELRVWTGRVNSTEKKYDFWK
jgi:hypothetical protein